MQDSGGPARSCRSRIRRNPTKVADHIGKDIREPREGAPIGDRPRRLGEPEQHRQPPVPAAGHGLDRGQGHQPLRGRRREGLRAL